MLCVLCVWCVVCGVWCVCVVCVWESESERETKTNYMVLVYTASNKNQPLPYVSLPAIRPGYLDNVLETKEADGGELASTRLEVRVHHLSLGRVLEMVGKLQQR